MRLALTALIAALLTATPAAAAPRDPFLAEAFGGLGSWVDIFDGPAWANPEAAVAHMRRRGVETLYLQSASSRPGPAVYWPERTARFLRAAHLSGMDVIAWYLPPHRDVAYEARRALGAVRFLTESGDGFDGFALDIETAPDSPASAALRTRRVLRVSRRLRRAVGPWYPLGAIIPSPSGLDMPHGRAWWPDFPYRQLNRLYDAFLPMGYYTYHGQSAAEAYRDTRRNFEILRAQTADPDVAIHMIGGGGGDSGYAEGRAFTRAVNRFGAIGASMYDHVTMGAEDWRALRGIRFRD
jgi:hypothetical protein